MAANGDAAISGSRGAHRNWSQLDLDETHQSQSQPDSSGIQNHSKPSIWQQGSGGTQKGSGGTRKHRKQEKH